MDDAMLAAVEHENMIATMSGFFANAPGHLVRRADGVALYASGLPIAFFNQVAIEDDRAAAAGLASAVAAIREHGRPFLVHLRRGADDRFAPLLEELGLVLPAGHPPFPGMALHPIGHSRTSDPDGHDIRRVTDQAGMEDHIRTLARGFGMPEEFLREILPEDTWLQPGNAVYVGYTDGEPVTTGFGVRTGTTIGVYNISTIESARRRGLGAAITERVGADGAAAGCDVAILQASPMGQPVYERIGYRTVVEYDGYTEPEAAG